jgi:DNA invertase Pin-like site-specific DNA recombinase
MDQLTKSEGRRTMKVAIYARVSTSNNGQDPTMQTRELREYAERRGWTVTNEYVDIGISGTKETRPQLDRLMADAHRRRFLGAVAELERSLIVERVKAGLRNARAKGKKLGRPRVYPDAHRIAALRALGLSSSLLKKRCLSMPWLYI